MDRRTAANKARARDPLARFVEKYKVCEDGCWQWTGATVTDRWGASYGSFWYGSKSVLAHRFVYEAVVGPIPDNMTIDHLCRNTICVNPDHLEVVTLAENIVRGQRRLTCVRGHARRPQPNGRWTCPTCDVVRSREYKKRKVAL